MYREIHYNVTVYANIFYKHGADCGGPISMTNK